MAELKTGLRSLTTRPWAYSLLQKVWGAEKRAKSFVDFLGLHGGERVLDIGCGTAFILQFMPPVEYIGFDPSADYIASAKAKYGTRGTFFAKIFDESDAAALHPIDVVIVSAVLHHLDDDEAIKLFSLLRRALNSGGRIVTLDNVFVAGQNPIAKLLISLDRGQNVRDPEAYESLARHAFRSIEGNVEHQAWPPYTYWTMTIQEPCKPP